MRRVPACFSLSHNFDTAVVHFDMILKSMLSYFTPEILENINISLSSDHFPEDLKTVIKPHKET